MPVFNDSRFLPFALDSLLTQTFKNYELIISDDFSTDGSKEICLIFARKDPRIRYIRQQKNIGIQHNMEFLIKQAKGDFFMWAADDDVWDKDFIQTLLPPLISDPKLVLVFCPYSFIDDDNQPIREMKIRSIDYSGSTRFMRLSKMCRYYDDGCGYGIFRKKPIENIHYPIWWGPNKKSSFNNIYPPLFFSLSVGDFELIKPKIMWFNRIKTRSHHFVPFYNNHFLRYFAYFLLKINVLYESIRSIFSATRSVYLCIAILPLLFFRFIFDVLYPLPRWLFRHPQK